jgi:hypothetical protein
MKNKNIKLLNDFKKYCDKHPDERFWQALRNWSGFSNIIASNKGHKEFFEDYKDTFYFEGKDK